MTHICRRENPKTSGKPIWNLDTKFKLSVGKVSHDILKQNANWLVYQDT